MISASSKSGEEPVKLAQENEVVSVDCQSPAFPIVLAT